MSTGNKSWSDGSRINPLTPKEAYDWAMKKLSANEFEEIFGTISEDESNHLLSVTIPENVHLTLELMASANNKKISEIIIELVHKNS